MALEDFNSIGPNGFKSQKKILRPKKFSYTSNTPYYREMYAIQMREVLDNIYATKRPQLWKYSDWPDYKPTTLYQRASYGLLFLVDHMDPDGKYLALKTVLRIHPVPKKDSIGLAIYIRRDIDVNTLDVNPRAFLPRHFDEEGKEILSMIDSYLTNSDRKEPFEINCILTPKVIGLIQAQLFPLEGSIIFNVDECHVKIVKLI